MATATVDATRAIGLISRREIRQCKYAGLGFHSPNMMVSHRLKLRRSADVYDEEALAALILSGRYIGFLPDHFAKRFVNYTNRKTNRRPNPRWRPGSRICGDAWMDRPTLTKRSSSRETPPC